MINALFVSGGNRFGMPTLLLRTNFLGAAPLGCLDGQHRPAAFWAGLGDRRIPDRVFTIRISIAGIKKFTVATFTFDQAAFFAFRAVYPGISGLLQRLEEFAFGISRATDELAVCAGFYVQRAVAFRA